MILGFGLDAVCIGRLKSWENNPRLFERFFHPDELEAVSKKGVVKLSSLAARFAAKEAFGKAIGTGLAGFSLKELAVLNDRRGKPELILYGKAKEAFSNLGGQKVFVTLTHEHEYAIAAVIIEGSDERG